MDQYINDNDIVVFMNDLEMLNWWMAMAFLYVYVLCVTDRCTSEAVLSHPAESQVVEDLVNYKDDAFFLVVVMNSHDGWTKRFEKKIHRSDPIHNKCIGRWTSNDKTKNKAGADWRTTLQLQNLVIQ